MKDGTKLCKQLKLTVNADIYQNLYSETRPLWSFPYSIFTKCIDFLLRLNGFEPVTNLLRSTITCTAEPKLQETVIIVE